MRSLTVVGLLVAVAAVVSASGCGGGGAAGSTTLVPDAVSITSAPVQTANTRLGRVAYRAERERATFVPPVEASR